MTTEKEGIDVSEARPFLNNWDPLESNLASEIVSATIKRHKPQHIVEGIRVLRQKREAGLAYDLSTIYYDLSIPGHWQTIGTQNASE